MMQALDQTPVKNSGTTAILVGVALIALLIVILLNRMLRTQSSLETEDQNPPLSETHPEIYESDVEMVIPIRN